MFGKCLIKEHSIRCPIKMEMFETNECKGKFEIKAINLGRNYSTVNISTKFLMKQLNFTF